MKKPLFSLLGALAISGGLMLTNVGTSYAHGTGPHGGLIGHAEGFNVEIVKTSTGLEIYLIDKEMKQFNIGPFEATAIVQHANQRENLTLVSFGDGQMKSNSALAANKEAKVIVILKPKDKAPIQVSFEH